MSVTSFLVGLCPGIVVAHSFLFAQTFSSLLIYSEVARGDINILLYVLLMIRTSRFVSFERCKIRKILDSNLLTLRHYCYCIRVPFDN